MVKPENPKETPRLVVFNHRAQLTQELLRRVPIR